MMAMNVATRTMTEQPAPAAAPSGPAVREADRREWLRAASLSERVQAHRRRGSLPGLLAGAQARGYRPEQAWRAQSPFPAAAVFGRRLALEGISEREFRAILGGAAAPAAAGGEECPPWLGALLAAYGRDALPGGLDLPAPTPLAAAVADVLEPLISAARLRLGAGLRGLVAGWTGCPVDADAVEQMLTVRLLSGLTAMVGMTLLLECQGADIPGSGMVEGDVDDWPGFLDGLCRREDALAMFRRFPVLARLVWERLEAWEAAGLAFLRHLREDWPALQAVWGTDPGGLVAIEGWAPDHPWGRPDPWIACFASGLRLEYKPRSAAADLHFQELLAWINRRDPRLAFYTRTVLDRGDHGWLDAVMPAPCRSAAELDRLHWRQGALAGLLYAFDAADFPADRVVTAGEHPVLMDVDVLFQRPVAELAGDIAEAPRMPSPVPPELAESADSGFAALYGLVAACRDELLAETGPVARFAGDELRLRLRLRPEATYMQLLDEACHPEYLGDALDRDRLFDRLWVAVAEAPDLDPVIAGEQAALRRGRVPEFIARPGSRDLVDPSGRVLAGFWPEAPLERIRRRLERAGEVGRGA